MVAGGHGPPQFLSLSPSEYPLPSCLSGTKKKINVGDAHRRNPALFHSKGKSMLSIIKKMLWFQYIIFDTSCGKCKREWETTLNCRRENPLVWRRANFILHNWEEEEREWKMYPLWCCFRLMDSYWFGHVSTEMRFYSLQILLSRTQAGPGRTVKQEQEEIAPNHVKTD